MFKERRAELRKAADAEIEKLKTAAIFHIKQVCATALTELVATGLTSEAARRFLEKVRTPEKLMPPLDLKEIEKTAKPLTSAERSGIRYRSDWMDE
jgi:hypothetical protein